MEELQHALDVFTVHRTSQQADLIQSIGLQLFSDGTIDYDQMRELCMNLFE